jgi:magnesium chelatase family protein
MTPAEVRECALDDGAASLLADSYARRRLGGRAHDRVMRLAQTLADLAGAETIGREQMAQALRLRRRDQEGANFRFSTLTRP